MTPAAGQPLAPAWSSASTARLEQVLATTVAPEGLLQLHQIAAAHEDAARHCRLAFEEFTRLAIFRLRVERKLGATLALVVRRGGSRSTRLTSSGGRLPSGLTKQMAARYRQLANIDDHVFESYLARSLAARRAPSANGARAFARGTPATTTKPAPPTRRGRGMRRGLPTSPAVVDALHRFLGTIDVYVGRDTVPCKTRILPEHLQLRALRGRVLVATVPEPWLWLPALVRGRLDGAIEEVLVVVPAATEAAWFRCLGEPGWCCCFVVGAPALVIAYHGPRQRLLALALRELGTLLQPLAN